MRRRSVLAGIASAASVGGVASLAGCLNLGSGASGASLEDHPASRSMADQPYLGDPPRDAEKLVVAFEDPSCPTCRRFHSSGFQDLQAEIIEPDSASFVYRPYRLTGRAWATPAIHAVLETTARERTAAWDLLDFYYDEQSALSSGSIAEDTRDFLAENTEVDADAVVQAAEARAHRSILETAESDGDEAGVTSTPTFYLFADGQFTTELSGAQDVTAFEAGFEL